MLAVGAQLPVEGVYLILANDLMGEYIFPRHLVSSNPKQNNYLLLVQNFPATSPAYPESPAAPGLQPVLQMGREQLISAQKTNPSLACCIESVAN